MMINLATLQIPKIIKILKDVTQKSREYFFDWRENYVGIHPRSAYFFTTWMYSSKVTQTKNKNRDWLTVDPPHKKNCLDPPCMKGCDDGLKSNGETFPWQRSPAYSCPFYW